VGNVVAFVYKRHREALRWVAFQNKMNENYSGGVGHFFPRKAIVNVFFGENVGYEKNGQRPAVVVSSDTVNRTSGNITVVPLTKEENKIDPRTGKVKKLLDSQYRLLKNKYKLNYNSIVQCEDIRTVSKERIGDIIDFVDDTDMKQIEKRLKFLLEI
jgi:mRNA interferase MazF